MASLGPLGHLVQQIFEEDILHEEITIFLAVNTAGVVRIHLALFCVCMYILLQNRQTAQWFILVSAILMFALSTADIAITFRLLTHDIVNAFDPAKNRAIVKFIYAKTPLFVSNNLVADLVLLYRCYMIWGRSKYILIGASFLILADTVWGYLGLTQSFLSPNNTFVPLYIWSIFAINITLALVTAGRIYWVTRIARNFLGRRQLEHTILPLPMESSLVYTTCILIYALYPRNSFYRMVIITICLRVVAIMPTLLIVQVGLHRAVRDDENPTTDSTDETKSEFVARRAPTSVVLDTVITMGHHPHQNITERIPQPSETPNSSRRFFSRRSEQHPRMSRTVG
ncbi:hypothetical protein CPB84DRAFT_1777949 [Gymnopilus junonius]|uniref:Uncharacterized protein n=1 Tax=Gymnopilus junonius TaxID=109634 RepID=A0A9P5TNL8_GYMJU|nr:hypothetical protein CPB84DRAFT_1777949 [Gymnopilus junonius]